METENSEIDQFIVKIRKLCRDGLCEEAIQHCHDLLGVWEEREHHHIYGRLAHVYRQMGDPSAALQCLNEALKLTPDSRARLDDRMVLAMEIGDFKLGCDDATKLIEVERERGSIAFVESAHVRRAYALIQLGESKSALRDLEGVSYAGPYWINGKLWSRDEIINLARSRP